MTLLDSFSPSLLCKNETTTSMMKCAIGNPKRGKDRESMFFPQEKSEFELKNTQENESQRLSAPVFGAYCLCSIVVFCVVWDKKHKEEEKKNGSRN